MSKIKMLWEKLKKVKHFYIYVTIAIALVLCGIYFVSFKKGKTSKNSDVSTQEASSTMEYVTALENKLASVLSNISGVSKVSVIITLEEGFSYKYATDTETKTIVSGGTETTVVTETVIMVSNQPVVEKEIYPNIKGVVVVAKGAENVSVKMNIVSAVETVLKVEPNRITVLS